MYVKGTRGLGHDAKSATNLKRKVKRTPREREIGGIIDQFVKKGAAIIWI
jgi:hypothetical protein